MGGESRRSRRRLGPEERRLWERIAATATPLRRAYPQTTRLPGPPEGAPPDPGPWHPPEPAGTAHGPLPRRGESAESRRPEAVRPLPAGTGPSTSVRLASPEAGPVGRPQAGLDRRTAERLRKGARHPDARIDLHGMTAERAHRACLAFLGDSLGRGDRVVLVITGKGRRRGDGWRDGPGILRDSLPGWLRASPVGHSIVGIYQAHRRHGGEGAFYVYLKRRR